jgi:hypothetical protein
LGTARGSVRMCNVFYKIFFSIILINTYLYNAMISKYKFISDEEPSDEDLAIIMAEATVTVIEKANEAKKNYTELFNSYLLETKKKYEKIIINHAKTT